MIINISDLCDWKNIVEGKAINAAKCTDRNLFRPGQILAVSTLALTPRLANQSTCSTKIRAALSLPQMYYVAVLNSSQTLETQVYVL